MGSQYGFLIIDLFSYSIGGFSPKQLAKLCATLFNVIQSGLQRYGINQKFLEEIIIGFDGLGKMPVELSLKDFNCFLPLFTTNPHSTDAQSVVIDEMYHSFCVSLREMIDFSVFFYEDLHTFSHSYCQ